MIDSVLESSHGRYLKDRARVSAPTDKGRQRALQFGGHRPFEIGVISMSSPRRGADSETPATSGRSEQACNGCSGSSGLHQRAIFFLHRALVLWKRRVEQRPSLACRSHSPPWSQSDIPRMFQQEFQHALARVLDEIER